MSGRAKIKTKGVWFQGWVLNTTKVCVFYQEEVEGKQVL